MTQEDALWFTVCVIRFGTLCYSNEITWANINSTNVVLNADTKNLLRLGFFDSKLIIDFNGKKFDELLAIYQIYQIFLHHAILSFWPQGVKLYAVKPSLYVVLFYMLSIYAEHGNIIQPIGPLTGLT